MHPVRVMLRLANDPAHLASLPLVRELCALTRTNDPCAMLEGIVSSAFSDSLEEQRLREILMHEDGCAAASRRFNLSLRHFHRVRSHAVYLVSLRIQDILDSVHPDAPYATEAARFKIASIEFERAKHESNLERMHAALRTMRAHSCVSRELEFRRHFALAAFLLRSGQWEQARAVYEEIANHARITRNVRSLAMCAQLYAELSLVGGRYDEAEAAATAAEIALADDATDGVSLAILRAQVQAARGEPWDGRELLRRIPEMTFEHAAAMILTARFLLIAGDTLGAEMLAVRAFAQCVEQRLKGLLSAAHVALGAVADAKGDQLAAAAQYEDALQSIIETGDRLIAFWAFGGALPHRRCGPFESPEPAVKACLSRLRFLFGASPQRIDWDALEPVLAQTVNAALNAASRPLQIAQDGTMRDLLVNHASFVQDTVRLTIATVLPASDREPFLRRFFEIFAYRE